MKHGIAFSGGKDSWALLWLFEERLSEFPVFWVNTGKVYPETREMVEKARAMCPLFVEVKSSQEEQNARMGLPADIVPVNWTPLGQATTRPKPYLVQAYLLCCHHNIAQPLIAAAKEHDVTHLIVGQRLDEEHRAPYDSGSVQDGITQFFPLSNWSEADVFHYLQKKMEIPEHFYLKHSSLDCYDCTAFRKDSVDRVAWMEKKHPDLHALYKERLDKLNAAILQEIV